MEFKRIKFKIQLEHWFDCLLLNNRIAFDMWRSMNYGARISAPNDLFWRAALVTSGNLQWRAALWSVTAEMAARYPQHMAIRSKYLASTMDDDVTKEPRSVSRASRRSVNGKTYRPGNVRIYSATITQSKKWLLGWSFRCPFFSKFDRFDANIMQ